MQGKGCVVHTLENITLFVVLVYLTRCQILFLFALTRCFFVFRLSLDYPYTVYLLVYLFQVSRQVPRRYSICSDVFC